MASAQGEATGTVGNVSLTTILRDRLRSEGMKDVEINANSVHVPGGQLMATFTLSFPESLPDDRRLRMEKMTLEECATYLHGPHDVEASLDETRHESRAMGSVRKETKLQTPPILRT
jgi:hypothetical protein